MPPGLTFDPTTGAISGTPSAVSPSANYTITAYNMSGSSSTVVNITVNEASPVAVTPPKINYHTPDIYLVNKTITNLYSYNSGGDVPTGIYGQVTGYVGNPDGLPGKSDGLMLASSFDHPEGLGLDAASGNFYVADRDNGLIRMVTRQAYASTFVIGFSQPNGVVVSPNGDLYVADGARNTVSLVKANGAISTFAGSGTPGVVNAAGTAASFNNPGDLAMDSNGNLFVADWQNNAIRKITPAGVVSTFAGGGGSGYADGTGTSALFNLPRNIAIDQANNLYISDANNNRIRKITPSGVVTTVAGTGTAVRQDGPVAGATFNSPAGLAVDYGGDIFVADAKNHVIRRIDSKGTVSTMAGSGNYGDTDGQGSLASFSDVHGLILAHDGSLFVSDYDNNRVKIISAVGYTIDKALPPGVSFDPLTGIISGTPTTSWPPTDYTISAYNMGGSSTQTINIRVVTPISFALLPTKTLAIPISIQTLPAEPAIIPSPAAIVR